MSRFGYLVLVFGLWLLSGCTSEKTYAVSGQVTLDGQPIPSGEVLFLPIDKGSLAADKIKDGVFHLRSQPGKMRVEIRSAASQLPTKEQMQLTGQSGIEEYRIPARYNHATTLSVEVSPQEDRNQFNFALHSDSKHLGTSLSGKVVP